MFQVDKLIGCCKFTDLMKEKVRLLSTRVLLSLGEDARKIDEGWVPKLKSLSFVICQQLMTMTANCFLGGFVSVFKSIFIKSKFKNLDFSCVTPQLKDSGMAKIVTKTAGILAVFVFVSSAATKQSLYPLVLP